MHPSLHRAIQLVSQKSNWSRWALPTVNGVTDAEEKPTSAASESGAEAKLSANS